MNADDVLAQHTKGKGQKCDFPGCNAKVPSCVRCREAWGENGCDAVVMAREVKRLREALLDVCAYDRAYPDVFAATPELQAVIAKVRSAVGVPRTEHPAFAGASPISLAALAAEGEKA